MYKNNDLMRFIFYSPIHFFFKVVAEAYSKQLLDWRQIASLSQTNLMLVIL